MSLVTGFLGCSSNMRIFLPMNSCVKRAVHPEHLLRSVSLFSLLSCREATKRAMRVVLHVRGNVKNFLTLVISSHLFIWECALSIQICWLTSTTPLFECLGLSFWHCWDPECPVKSMITRIPTVLQPESFVLMMALCSHSCDSGPTANWRCGGSVLNSSGKIIRIHFCYM